MIRPIIRLEKLIGPLKAYLLFSGIAVHIGLFLIVSFFIIENISNHWRFKAFQEFIQGPIDKAPVYQIPLNTRGKPDYSAIPENRWLKIHQQSKTDKTSFARQRHSGSAWDSKRQRLIIFGSDTHGENWDNSIYTFNLENIAWRQEYSPTSIESYTVDRSGVPITKSKNGPRPWAMHTFDAINYLPHNDQLVVASYPNHLKPGRFGNWLETLWPKITRHPTWIYDFSKKSWHIVEGKAQQFFPYATAYNTKTNNIIGFRPNGIFEFNSNTATWAKVGKNSVHAYHTQAIYDAKNDTFLIFGGSQISNDIHTYKAGETKSVKKITVGETPPKTQHTPFAYHKKMAKAVALVDTTSKDTGAETWVYDLNQNFWEQIETATFPYKVGMNYHMQYSPNYNLLVLFTNARKEPPSVWILRL